MAEDEWDGITERRKNPIPGKEGRRSGDVHCPDHAIIQESTKEHRSAVCGKIRMIKEDAEKDLEALKSYHDKDLEEVKSEMGKDLRGVYKFVSIMITVASLIIVGQAVWLKADISDIVNKLQRVNQRITEGVDQRVAMDREQSRQLENISGEMRVVSWRLSQLEETHKPNKDGK